MPVLVMNQLPLQLIKEKTNVQVVGEVQTELNVASTKLYSLLLNVVPTLVYKLQIAIRNSQINKRNGQP